MKADTEGPRCNRKKHKVHKTVSANSRLSCQHHGQVVVTQIVVAKIYKAHDALELLVIMGPSHMAFTFLDW